MSIILANSRILEYLPEVVIPAIFATLRMLFFSLTFGLIFGIIIGFILVLTSSEFLMPNKRIYKIVDFIIGMIRSFPIIILIVAIAPLTNLIVGTSIGEVAAIIPLSIAATPIIARLIETSLMEVDKNVIMAAKSFGATNFQIIYKVMFLESLPSIVSGLSSAAIIFLGSTTVAGTVGAGGLGAVALTYGYQRFDDQMMYFIVIIVFVLVLLIQIIGKICYKKIKKD